MATRHMTRLLHEAPVESGTTSTLPREDDKFPEIGEWYWFDRNALKRLRAAEPEPDEIELSEDLEDDDPDPDEEEESDVDDTDEEDGVDEPDEEDDDRWLGAITHVGTNYVMLEGFAGGEYGGTHGRRIHFDVFDAVCTPEPNAEAIINGYAAKHTGRARELMAQVQEITRRLGVAPRAQLEDGTSGETQALAVRGSGESIESYKKSLIKAKTDQLPALFKAIERENKIAAGWMTAQLIPMKAKAAALKPMIKAIENRIFSVELYAGLKEKVVQVTGGAPAPIGTKITLMQRRCYMDEESLAQYEAGGMDYKDIGDFDAWIARPVNLNRILPKPRCVVAFRIRRYDKEREAENLGDFIRIFEEREADKQTYLYIRNGEQLFRLKTAIDFGAELFPDLDRLDTAQKLYVKRDRHDDGDFLITEGRYVELVSYDERHEASKRTVKFTYQGEKKAKPVAFCSCNEKELKAKEPSPPGPWFWCNYRSAAAAYEAFTPDSVYYDDATAHLAEEQARHNRLVLVLQGLLDRSPVFHPHPPWQLWTSAGFTAGLHLVYDSGRAITPGAAPDFEAYRARLNASIKVGSMTVGQDDAWQEREAALENARQARDHRIRYKSDYRRYKPDNNPGPGTVARVSGLSKRGVTFQWTRKKKTGRKVWKESPNRPGWGRYETVYDDITDNITVPKGRLLNIDAYTPGDFHQFFDDPRTRADYIKWAPLLLVAEDAKAGKHKMPRRDPMPDGSLRCGGMGHRWSGNTKVGDPCECGMETWEGMAKVGHDDGEDAGAET